MWSQTVDYAQKWMDFGVTRSVCKRSVMVFGYNSKPYGFARQIMEDTMEPLYDDVLAHKLEKHPFGDDKGKKAARFLAGHLWVVVNEELRSGTGYDILERLRSDANTQRQRCDR